MKEWLKEWSGVLIFIAIIGGVILYNAYKPSPSTTSSSQVEEKQPNPDGYSSCSAAHEDGVYDIPDTSSAYKSKQDADHDGVACEHYLGN